MWFQNTKAHYSVFSAPQHTKLATLRGPGPTAFCFLGLYNRGDDVIQEVWEAALQLVTLTDKIEMIDYPAMYLYLQVNNFK